MERICQTTRRMGLLLSETAHGKLNHHAVGNFQKDNDWLRKQRMAECGSGNSTRDLC